MKNPRLYFRAYLTALLMLAAVPAKTAEVKELFGSISRTTRARRVA